MAASDITFSGRNWLRSAQLIVLKSSNDVALDLSNLRFRFEVRADDADAPNNMTCRVYNPSEHTRKTIIKEFDRVILSAGYVGGVKGDLFQGTIMQFKHGRERNVDSYLDIVAADGDTARNYAMVNSSRPAGLTDAQELSDLANAMNIPISKGTNDFIATGGIFPNPRGKVCFGMAKDYMRIIAAKNRARWSIQNGELTLIPNNGYLTGSEIVQLNTWSGMLGTPESTSNGIEVNCYLNPQIRVGELVQINNQDINQTTFAAGNVAHLGSGYFAQFYPASTSEDGFYRVLVAEHAGDTRGDMWQTSLTCLVADLTSKSVPTN